MSTQSETQVVAAPAAAELTRGAPAAALGVLLGLTATHFLVDVFASTVTPLWPSLQSQLALGEGAVFGLYLAWTIATSVSQLLFGWLGDRLSGRWLLWAGPLAAVVCLSSIGLVRSPLAVAGLLVIGGLGIAAFHPEAAALAGASVPDHRSRAMSVFAIGGYLGQAVGPTYSGLVTDRYGLAGLSSGLLWGMAALAAVAWAVGRADQQSTVSTRSVAASGLRERWPTLLLVLVISSLRVVAALGVPLAVAYLLAERGATNSVIGMVQSMFMAGIGAGGIACAVLVRRHHERLVLWALPLAAAPLLASLPYLGGTVLAAGVGGCGLLLGVALPVLISYGQQVLPDGQRVASSITMGVSWGAGGLVVAAVMFGLEHLGERNLAFAVFAAAASLSSVLCAWLPRTDG
jgi:FSR family fosmidomycin resistance protein-like MFS transporter